VRSVKESLNYKTLFEY